MKIVNERKRGNCTVKGDRQTEIERTTKKKELFLMLEKNPTSSRGGGVGPYWSDFPTPVTVNSVFIITFYKDFNEESSDVSPSMKYHLKMFS